MKILRICCRILTGVVFIFSGTVKAIDPLGSAYKFHDYFQAFNLGFLDNLSLPLAVLLCTAEFIAGFSVLTGVLEKSGIRLIMILMIIFTPLTLVLALTNPVSDCGCFGDAVHLTNWQTFWKNVVLIAAAIMLYSGIKQSSVGKPARTEYVVISTVSLIFILFAAYNLRYLPVIDFLPYKKGIRIADQMVIPEGAPSDQYHTTFIYEKDGVRKEFSLEDYPSNDTSWKFIDQKSVLVSKGYQPPIHDFIITSPDGRDITGEILSEPGPVMLMISRKLNDAGRKALEEGFRLGKSFTESGYRFYVVTASGSEETASINNGLIVCSADETTLKTMIRANPGYMLLKNGIITGKWSGANLPDYEWFRKNISETGGD